MRITRAGRYTGTLATSAVDAPLPPTVADSGAVELDATGSARRAVESSSAW